MYFKAYLQTQCLFAWHHGKIKRNQRRPQKKHCRPPTYCGAKSANESQNNSKGPCEDAGGNRYKVSISTVKWVLYWHNLKGRSVRKKPLLQNRHKKAKLVIVPALRPRSPVRLHSPVRPVPLPRTRPEVRVISPVPPVPVPRIRGGVGPVRIHSPVRPVPLGF